MGAENTGTGLRPEGCGLVSVPEALSAHLAELIFVGNTRSMGAQ
jgi:hypothetical protein